MQHTDLNRIIDRNVIKSLMEQENTSASIRLACHCALIGAAGFALSLAEQIFMQLLCSIILGLLLVFLFAPLHETIHKTAFKSRALNAVVSWLCGLVIFLPPGYFQAFHMAHHRHTQIPGKDPELDTRKPESRLEYFFIMSGLVYWYEQTRSIITMALGKTDFHFVKEQHQVKLVREARLFMTIYGLLFGIGLVTGFEPLLRYWIVPIILGQPFLRLYLIAEHTMCPTVPDMLVNTRTTQSNPMVRFLAWNMPYHVEHHVWPGIPFHKLALAHEQIRPHIQHLSPGYIAVNRDILQSISGRD